MACSAGHGFAAEKASVLSPNCCSHKADEMSSRILKAFADHSSSSSDGREDTRAHLAAMLARGLERTWA